MIWVVCVCLIAFNEAAATIYIYRQTIFIRSMIKDFFKRCPWTSPIFDKFCCVRVILSQHNFPKAIGKYFHHWKNVLYAPQNVLYTMENSKSLFRCKISCDIVLHDMKRIICFLLQPVVTPFILQIWLWAWYALIVNANIVAI